MRVTIALVLAVVVIAAVFFLRRAAPAPPAPAARPAESVPAAKSASPAPERPAATTKPEAAAPVKRAPAKAAPVREPEPKAPAADVATLTITSDVPGAQVFIDREFVGATPLTTSNIKPGSHRLNVSAEGYDGHAETIDVVPGPREIVVNFKTVRLDAALDVVHRHRMGSCKGRLIATPDGIRYETPDKNDAFAVSLADLQAFEVDYLEKNLRVQPRKGRRYDFTDPDGNADRLFVFHRDVQKVRERLKN